MTLAAPDGSKLAPLAPVDCHRACAPTNDELLVDNSKGMMVKWVNEDEPLRLDEGDVGE